ncbi:hypothetical protein FB45DRAFT_1023175 [Roridomyces roridus]|uniref:Uncharacterized protein n=1 Tax=Roridomyces roridus TaxID=1738132 RepID=A0AAD7C3R5_9AGAR|nr:hypothetical protein FB45DRAFT_1023175 [Roridomyces roridus]
MDFPSPFIPYGVQTEQRDPEMSWGPPPRTLAELRMYGLSWAIRSKPEWQRKITDATIMEKWRQEALDQQENTPVEQKMTPKMINFVLTELEAYARLSDPVLGIESGPFDAIWYSDRLIPMQVSQRLREAIIELEDVPEELKDWHPRSNRQVLDLVHPSLYPVLYGRTLLSSGSPVQPPAALPDFAAEHSLSTRFCWLPSDFRIDSDGTAKLISPYINNLHPKHTCLYQLVESIVSSFVPLFERVLSEINGQDKDLLRDVTPGSGRIKPTRGHGSWPRGGYSWKFQGISVGYIWSGPAQPYPENLDSNPDWETPKVLPEAFEQYTGELEKQIAPYPLRGKTIQCIVKFANIHLTVDDPEYKGGSWHVEGMINERIVASGIYYYDEDNITESRLAFRMTTAPPVYHLQDDELCMELLYGLAGSGRCMQDIGSIPTKQGRALAWPNIYQHRVSPFRLLDPTKAGHRKIMAIFLVDPSIEPMPSATNIPSQQAEWIFDALEDARWNSNSLVSRLPPELVQMISEHACEGTVSRQEAEEYRLELMEERTVYTEHGDDWEYTWNMCEH